MAWGENNRPQDGPGVLVHPAQPGHLLEAGQTQLFDGIHLPDRVRRGGDGDPGGRLAAGRCRRLLVAAEPALQRADAGQVRECGVEQAEPYPQIGRPPGGMLLMQQQRLLQRHRRRGRLGTLIGRCQGGGAAALERLTESADGAGGEAELPGQGGGVFATLPEQEELLPQGV